MPYVVSLKQFDGPLDLLLTLISRAKVDIQDIFVSEITEQYLESMSLVDELDMDSASEFLQMAATLLEIKSRAMLPKPPKPEEEGELSYWEVLFKANSFADLLDRLNMIQEIAAADRRRLTQLRAAAEEVTQAQKVLQEEAEALEETRRELDATNAELAAKQQEAEETLAELVETGRQIDGMFEAFEADEAAIMAEIAKMDEQIVNALHQIVASGKQSIKAKLESATSTEAFCLGFSFYL